MPQLSDVRSTSFATDGRTWALTPALTPTQSLSLALPLSLPVSLPYTPSVPLPITVTSDIVCPWCFIGHRRLGQALVQLPELEAKVDWRPYQLHPYLPREGASFDEHYRRKFGAHAEMLRDRMHQAGESAAIDFQFDLIERVPNTLAAHTVISWAPAGETRTAVVERLFEGYFLEGQDVGDSKILATLASEAGLDKTEIAQRLARDDDRERVAAEADENRRGGITGVPFFLIGERYPIVGAQTPETMVQVIERVLEINPG